MLTVTFPVILVKEEKHMAGSIVHSGFCSLALYWKMYFQVTHLLGQTSEEVGFPLECNVTNAKKIKA